jgi:hypothetical protein
MEGEESRGKDLHKQARELMHKVNQKPTPGSDHVGFVVDKVAPGQVFSKSFSFPCLSSFHQCSTITIIHHLGLVQQASSGGSTRWTQSHPTKNNNKSEPAV